MKFVWNSFKNCSSVPRYIFFIVSRTLRSFHQWKPFLCIVAYELKIFKFFNTWTWFWNLGSEPPNGPSIPNMTVTALILKILASFYCKYEFNRLIVYESFGYRRSSCSRTVAHFFLNWAKNVIAVYELRANYVDKIWLFFIPYILKRLILRMSRLEGGAICKLNLKNRLSYVTNSRP